MSPYYARLNRIQGVNCISGQIRSFTSGGFTPGIKVTKNPWRVITLKKANAAEWIPILKELVNVQRKGSAHKMTHIDEVDWKVTIPITIPLAAIGQKSWNQIMDDYLQKKFDGVPKKPEPTPAEKEVGERTGVGRVQAKDALGST
jgi:hypothetical protein